MKYLLVLVVVLVVLWLMLRRRDAPPPAAAPPKDNPGTKPESKAPQQMLACAHCGVHLPQAEAQMDVGGRPFCSEAHRLAGPR